MRGVPNILNRSNREKFRGTPRNLRRVFEKLKEAKLKLNPSKCNLFRHEVNYLGHIISADGVRTDPQKVSAVKDWRRPKNVHELRSFLGLCTYYRRFVKGFSSIARPLHRLTENKQKFLWTDECEEAFNSLKAALTSSPILVYPDPEKQFILDTDASHESVGAVLSQEINGQEHVIAYWSKCLSKPERNYCVTRKELLAIVKAVENFHSYLYGRKFLLRTDHASLTWLLNFKNTEGQIARWIQKLEEYDFEIKHRKGSLHDCCEFEKKPSPKNIIGYDGYPREPFTFHFYPGIPIAGQNPHATYECHHFFFCYINALASTCCGSNVTETCQTTNFQLNIP
ncbi:retrovirus-related Pol polyprotein from transposon 17.6 [Trichonephila clavata]|uniref:RNA-directed DNA polymerase n=1 Tax=Trichonephila clavata TaxID=2740835 RepID=A0A8X6J2Z5_TRICU|nr:retrovirus-related Pol polyprotein from transposon 17.6 [Trichonephila clavata]